MLIGARCFAPIGEQKKCAAVLPLSQNTAGWNLANQQAAIADQNPRYWINYRPDAEGVTVPGYIPMFTAHSQVTGANIDAAVTAATAPNGGGNKYIAVFNEPDGASAISTGTAIADWETIATRTSVVNAGIKLISPSTASDGSVGGSWFATFMAGITHQPDLIAVHTYGNASNTANLTAQIGSLLGKINNYHAAYPNFMLFVTETGNNTATATSDAQITQFMATACQWLELHSAVAYYAWWFTGPNSFGVTAGFSNDGLYDDSAVIRPNGTEYRDNCGKRPTISVG